MCLIEKWKRARGKGSSERKIDKLEKTSEQRYVSLLPLATPVDRVEIDVLSSSTDPLDGSSYSRPLFSPLPSLAAKQSQSLPLGSFQLHRRSRRANKDLANSTWIQPNTNGSRILAQPAVYFRPREAFQHSRRSRTNFFLQMKSRYLKGGSRRRGKQVEGVSTSDESGLSLAEPRITDTYHLRARLAALIDTYTLYVLYLSCLFEERK